jgi:hypothetical protein
METEIEKIKTLLYKFEIANSKVEYDFFERCVNPAQMGAAERFYNKAQKLRYSIKIDGHKFIELHREVIKKIKDETTTGNIRK